ncbi:MAG TPA: acyltransferase [Kofleriaceae bacterium]
MESSHVPERAREPAPPYYPALDGLRGIAVLGVMACHTLYRPFVLGWMGVPLFFALSGFLITGILLRTKDRPDYFRRFYKRRALRIFPIYYLFVLVSFIAGTLLSMPTHDLWRAVIYIQNYRIPGEPQQIPGFFGGHTWSLAVEEQFYLMWPLLVWLLSRTWLLRVCVALVIGSLVFRLWAFETSHDPGLWILYGWLPSNIDQLAAGAIVAILYEEKRLEPRMLLAAMITGAGLLAFLILRLPYDAWQTSDIWLHVPANVLLNTALAVMCAAGVGFFTLRPMLPWTWPPLQYVGRISYGMYLYHIPVYWIVWRLSGDLHHFYQTPIKVVATFIVAALSWHFIERRLLGKR